MGERERWSGEQLKIEIARIEDEEETAYTDGNMDVEANRSKNNTHIQEDIKSKKDKDTHIHRYIKNRVYYDKCKIKKNKNV